MKLKRNYLLLTKINPVFRDFLTEGPAGTQEHIPAVSNFRLASGKKARQSGWYIRFGTRGNRRGQKPSPLDRLIYLSGQSALPGILLDGHGSKDNL
jgi:hypothetical protein